MAHKSLSALCSSHVLQTPHRLLTFIVSLMLVTSSVITVPSLIVLLPYQLSCFSWNPGKLSTILGPLAGCSLCREWYYCRHYQGSNVFSLKPLFKCHFLKEVTHFNVNWHSHFSSPIFLVWSTSLFVPLYRSPSNILYSLFNIMSTVLPGFLLSPIKCELHKGRDLCLFFTVFQDSFYCLHVVGTQ